MRVFEILLVGRETSYCGRMRCPVLRLVLRSWQMPCIELILDFALTLLFNHLVLTTYYSASIPTSLFFWLVTSISAAGTVIFAEQLCVKREMSEGLVVASAHDTEDSVEMGSLLRED